MVPAAHGLAAAPLHRRRGQVVRGARPPVQSRPLDRLHPVASQGWAGALPAVRALREPALQRGPLRSMPGGGRHTRARAAAMPSPDEDPTLAVGHHITNDGGGAERRRCGVSGDRLQVPPEPYSYASGALRALIEAEGTTTTTTEACTSQM